MPLFLTIVAGSFDELAIFGVMIRPTASIAGFELRYAFAISSSGCS